jgi:hypothetical protein
MTPEERFHELDIAGCTWELMRQIDEQELIRIIKGQRLEKCWSGKDLCEISALWQLRQAENGEPVLCPSIVVVSIETLGLLVAMESLHPGDDCRRAQVLEFVERFMLVFGWSEQLEELPQEYGNDGG